MVTALSLMIAGSISQPIYVPPRCKAPPRNASAECVRCFEDECRTFIGNWDACDGDPNCSHFALASYAVRLAMCPCAMEASVLIQALNESQQRDALDLLADWPSP